MRPNTTITREIAKQTKENKKLSGKIKKLYHSCYNNSTSVIVSKQPLIVSPYSCKTLQ